MSGSVTADPIGAVLGKLLKPGAKTSEFIGLVAVYLGALATLLGMFNTSNPNFNAAMKMVAIGAAAASHIGFSLSRGNTKQALADTLSSLASFGLIAPTRAAPAPPKPASDGGYGLLGLIGAVLLVVGIIWLVVGLAHHHFDVFAAVCAAIGLVLMWFSGAERGRGLRL